MNVLFYNDYTEVTGAISNINDLTIIELRAIRVKLVRSKRVLQTNDIIYFLDILQSYINSKLN